MNELKQKFLALTEREQILVIISAVIVLFGLVYFAAWQPLVKGIEREKVVLERQTDTLSWVQSQAVKAAQLRSFTQTNGSFSGSLPQAVNVTSSRHQITITRMQPQNEELQVWVDEANFNNVLVWLQALEQMGVLIKQVDITESGTQGMIKVRRLQLGKA